MSRHLLEYWPAVARRMASARTHFIGLDFDGTLAPIVETPDSAVLSTDGRHALLALASQANVTVAVISGRALSDVRAKVGLDGVVYAGNHGLDILGPDLCYVHADASQGSAGLEKLANAIAERLEQIPGVLLENKGLTLSVHYRAVRHRLKAEVGPRVQAALEDTPEPFELTHGLQVWEIRPAVDWDKGAAAEWIMARKGGPAEMAWFFGDDTSDESAFRRLRGALTVKVGDPTDTAARYHVASTGEVIRALTRIASELTYKG